MKIRLRYKIVIVLGILLVLLLLFSTFEGVKKLSGVDYILYDIDGRVSLCQYDGDRSGGTELVGDVKQVFWDDKYIVAQAEGKYSDVYYIIEQLEADTFLLCNSGKKIPWNKKNGDTWITEEYGQYAPFCKRLQELNIDTTQMHHYSWKYWLGIY